MPPLCPQHWPGKQKVRIKAQLTGISNFDYQGLFGSDLRQVVKRFFCWKSFRAIVEVKGNVIDANLVELGRKSSFYSVEKLFHICAVFCLHLAFIRIATPDFLRQARRKSHK